MKFEVLKRLNFAGTIRMPGDVVEVDDEQADILRRMGLIAPAEVVATPKPRIRTRKVKDEAPAGSASDD